MKNQYSGCAGYRTGAGRVPVSPDKAHGEFQGCRRFFKSLPDTVLLETELVPIALYERLRKHFPFNNVKPVDRQIAAVRSIKSGYELSLMRKAGEIHKRILEDRVPKMLEEGMSEAELASRLYP